MPSREIDNLKSYFESKYSHVSIYWLECCVEWFKRNFIHYTQQSMCEQIYEQWLLADLRDIEVQSLPPGLSTEKKFTLNGNYVLQLMFLKDISRSSLSQLRKIRDMYKLTRSVTDTDNEPTGKRVLYLNLSDGIQEIKAVEFETVTSLNINLSPGLKLLLIGPLLLRNGEILLKNNNVKVLGGEVEELLVKNALENVLARELNLPENPNPRRTDVDSSNKLADTNITRNITNIQVNSFATSNRVPVSNQIKHGNLNNVVCILSDDEDSKTNPQNNIVSDDDDLFADIDIDEQLDKIEQQSVSLQHNQNLQNNISEDEAFLNIDVSSLERVNHSITPKQSASNTQQNADIDDIEYLEKIENEMKLQKRPLIVPTVTNTEPFVYIKQLLVNKDNIKANQTFNLKAQFLRIVEKLTVKKSRGWAMKFEITDSTDKMIVDFASDVIEKLLGLSAAQAIAEKNNIQNKTMTTYEKMSEVLKRCKTKLHTFNGIMTIRFNENNDVPTIINIEHIRSEHAQQLKNRVESASMLNL